MRLARLGLGLVLVVTLPYLPALGNGFVYDDFEVILAQPAPRAAWDLARVFAEPHFHGLPYYRPVVRATLLAQKALHGDRAFPFHAANLALLAAAALAAHALLRTRALGVRPGPAFLAAALFAVHPVASSAVLPIASGRETLLPAALALAALAAWLRGRTALAWLAFAATLLGREQAVVVPGLFALADALGLAPGRPTDAAPLVRRYAPGALLLLGYLAVRAALFAGGEWELALGEAPGGPLLSLVFAAQTIAAPFRALHYEPELAGWWSPVRLVVAALAAGGLGLACAAAGREVWPRALFWIGWLFLTLLPTANVLRQEARFDERYVLLALLAPLGLAAHLVSLRFDSARVRTATLAVGAALLAGCALVSAGRGPAFRDDLAFAEQWLRTSPASAEARHAFGLGLALRGRYAEALPQLAEAVRLDPAFADARCNLGAELLRAARHDEARRELEAALALEPAHPEAHNALGMLLAERGELEAALVHYQAALTALPRFAEAENNLGSALARLGRYAEAIPRFEAALRVEPGYRDAARNLSLARERLGAQGSR
jgi:tetratricopeptide (TPR) repeat protein